uniref:G-protein coupled receptors family 1 profile domain-containing protein n=1 Tax=Panagrolaimus davidi TaxID=227884 RepID=A0A914QPF9_9BILA
MLKQNILMEYVIMMPLSVISIILSLLIFGKIHGMKKMASEASASENRSLKDLQKAAIICVVQPLGFLIYNTLIFIGEGINIQISSADSPLNVPDSWIKLYLIISTFYPFTYLIAMLADTCLMLFSLRTYRNGMTFIWYKMILRTEPPPSSTAHELFVKTIHPTTTRTPNTFTQSSFLTTSLK